MYVLVYIIYTYACIHPIIIETIISIINVPYILICKNIYIYNHINICMKTVVFTDASDTKTEFETETCHWEHWSPVLVHQLVGEQ